MSIETVESNAWRHMDVGQDAIALERTRRLQTLMPGESISFVDAPPPPPAPMRQAQSASGSTNEVQAQAQSQSQSATTLQPAQAQQFADALQAQSNALIVLNLSPIGGLGGGAAALLATTSALAAAAAAAANAVGNAATTPPAPTASADKIAMYELLLDDKLLKEVVAAYCAEKPTSLPSNATTDALVAQYGKDLTCRLFQASNAITRVFDDYRDAMDRSATAGHEAGGSGWVPTAGTAAQGDNDGTADSWHFDTVRFTADYAKGNSLAARAFADFHGKDGSFAKITQVLTGNTDAGEIYTTNSGGIDPDSAKFKREDINDGGSVERWESARMGRNALVQIDLNDPLEMYDPKAVWFDPTLGFVTANENIVPEDSTMENIVILAVVAFATCGIGTLICEGVGVATVGFAGGAIMGATGAVIGGLWQNGTVSFEDVVRGAVTGAIMGAVSECLDAKGIDPKTGAVTDWGTRMAAIGAKAGIQGLLAEISGGEFKDAFGPGIASGIAAEVGRSINLAIDKAIDAKGLTAEQASSYRFLGPATTNAIAALGHPDSPLAKFAEDFLGDTLKAEIKVPANMAGGKTAVATSQGNATLAESNANSTQGNGQQAVITEREQQGIDQSDEILFNRGDELAATKGLNPSKLADGSLQYPDGRIRTPSGQVITLSDQDSGPSSAYPSQYRYTPATQGVMPVGGFQNLVPAPDVAALPPEATPILSDGRFGSSVAYRDQAGQVFYATYDAEDKPVRWLSAASAAPAATLLATPAAAQAARGMVAAELTSGNAALMTAAGVTLLGATWWLTQNPDGSSSLSQALPPEKVREDQQPLINVPVSPGPAGTPGQVADNRDTSIPGYEVTNRPLETSTTTPIIELSWEDLIVDATAPGWVLVNGVPYRADLAAHLTGPDGFRGGKLFGSHNLEVATGLLQGSNYWLTPTSTAGIYELNYDYLDSSGTRTVASPPKTVYDPSVISDQTMLDAATKAGDQAWASYLAATGIKPSTYIVVESGIKFQVYINTDSQGNAYVGNVHPVR